MTTIIRFLFLEKKIKKTAKLSFNNNKIREALKELGKFQNVAWG